MAQRRRRISTDIGLATEVPIEYFLEHVLPPLHPHIDVDKVLGRLKRHGKRGHRPITRVGRWWGFPKDPETTMQYEKTSFLNFPKIVDAIAKCGAPKGVQPSLDLFHNSQPGSLPSERDEDALPDAYMVLRGTSKTDVNWTNLSLFGEYRRNKWDRLHNIAKVSWSMCRAFQDPRRRFVFGYTVENASMRLWFCDRSQIIASEYFDFITDHKTVTHAFLSFLFAEPHQLGWDPSIQRIETAANGVQYDFTVESADGSTAIYRSLELFSESPSEIVVRGTRVWKVVQLIDGVPAGEPAVLKDAWVHEQLGREGTSLQRVREADLSDDFQKAFSKYFLTVLCHGDVILRSDRVPSYRDRTRQHSKNAEAYRASKPLPDPSLSIRHIPTERTSLTVLTGCKVHYRIVFKEICKPLHLSMPLSVVFPALGQITRALKLLHQVGWIHRDISMGNIMLDEMGQAKLADFEYSKKMDDETIPEIPVGTAPFASAEVSEQVYWCTFATPPAPRSPASNRELLRKLYIELDCPETSDDSGSSLDPVHRLVLAVQRRELARSNMPQSPSPTPPRPIPRSPKTPSPKPPPSPIASRFDNGFRYNPLHDLESVFWIATYFLFKSMGGGMNQEEMEWQRQIAKTLLYENYRHCCVIRLDGAYRQDLKSLPEAMRELGLILDEWRSELTERFYAAEKNFSSITSSVGDGLHESLAETLHDMSTLGDEMSVDGLQDSATKHPKRAREEVDNGLQTQASSSPPRPPKKARTLPTADG